MSTCQRLQLFVAVACISLTGFANPSSAQVTAATIAGRTFGTFLYGSRFPIAAVVRVEDLHGNSVKAVWSDKQGKFAIDGIAAGTYIVEVSRGQFLDNKRTVVLREGRTIRLNVVLREPPPQSNCPSRPVAVPFPTDVTTVKIRLERSSSCLGGCPAYTIDISGDGTVQYVGIAGVQHLGPLSYTISSDRVRKLTKMFYKKSFFLLCKDYSVQWTDLSGASTSIQIGDTTWAVEDYGDVGPKRLKSLNASIDKFAGPQMNGQH